MHIRRMILASLIVAMLMFVLVLPAFAQEGRDDGKGKACTGKGKRACEIPEVPVAAALPAAGLLAVAGYVIVDRRRRKSDAEAA
jgi:hypothetical protein